MAAGLGGTGHGALVHRITQVTDDIGIGIGIGGYTLLSLPV
ncbi:hypothetical protein KNE206_38340 [Kitasatospora sp. NE20-6]